ncbi:TIGR03032 family protein [Comamonas sp.]|uniref:TIGR03032 family protein n=1 Tax=Comamonas sp. TaxID=34028 RepID=UPI002FCA0787
MEPHIVALEPTSSTNPSATETMPNSTPTASVSDPYAFAAWLKTHDVALAFSTYRANRLIFMGRSDTGKLKLHERLFDRPMGLYVEDGAQGHSLWMAGRSQIWRFDNLLEPGQRHEGGDRLYVPAVCYTTGEVNAHEIVLLPHAEGTAQPLFVNTAFSCLATLGQGSSFVPTWKPSFVSKLSADDRCHLNGVALRGGAPTWVTACGTLDTPAGWREARSGGGVVLHVPSNTVVASGLAMPHSPRWHQGKLWLLNSGTGELGWLDSSKQAGDQFTPFCFMPGFARGLAFVGGAVDGEPGYAVVGLSKLRSPQFTGLPLEQKLQDLGLPGGCCGLRVIDLATGQIVHSLDLPEPIDELFDVVVLPGAQQPRALGLQKEDIHCLVKLPGHSQLTTIRPKAPSGNPHQANPPPVFGLPLALAEQATPGTNTAVKNALPIRYQQVFQLTPHTLAPYAAMTFPSLAPGAAALAKLAGELLAVSAMADGTMVGLAIAERQADGGAALVSLMVAPPLRRQGIAKRMVRELKRFLAQQGVQTLAAQDPIASKILAP